MSVEETIDYIEKCSKEILNKDQRIKSIVMLRRIIKLVITIDSTCIEAITWVCIGPERDHILVPRMYCSCKDYVIRVMSEKKRKSCIHLIAQKIAEETGIYREVKVSMNDYLKIVNEILKYNKSPTLRKILYGVKS